MCQPQFVCIANLGDVNPIDHGGAFVFVDNTGVYPPELELLVDPPESEPQIWTIYRIVLDPCTFIDGVLSDNKFHPESRAWFADDLISAARCNGMTEQDLIDLLCSDDPLQRATGYKALIDHHGAYEFDQDPLTMNRREVLKWTKICLRYRITLKQLQQPV